MMSTVPGKNGTKKDPRIADTIKGICKTEISLLKEIDHPNIVRLIAVYENGSDFALVTEMCEGRNLLFEMLEVTRLSELEAARVVKQVLLALNYLHRRNICHRDIKLENIIYVKTNGETRIKLIDLGIACKFNPDKGMTSQMGTRTYMAPEVLQDGAPPYTAKRDMWACGILFYILITGSNPYDKEDKHSQILAG